MCTLTHVGDGKLLLYGGRNEAGRVLGDVWLYDTERCVLGDVRAFDTEGWVWRQLTEVGAVAVSQGTSWSLCGCMTRKGGCVRVGASQQR